MRYTDAKVVPHTSCTIYCANSLGNRFHIHKIPCMTVPERSPLSTPRHSSGYCSTAIWDWLRQKPGTRESQHKFENCETTNASNAVFSSMNSVKILLVAALVRSRCYEILHVEPTGIRLLRAFHTYKNKD